MHPLALGHQGGRRKVGLCSPVSASLALRPAHTLAVPVGTTGYNRPGRAPLSSEGCNQKVAKAIANGGGIAT